MLKKIGEVLCLVVMLSMPTMALGETVQRFLVAPFQVHGPAKYQYLQKGIQSMLESRLTWEGKLVPAEGDQGGVQAMDSASEATSTLASRNLDYLVWGSLTIVGEQANVDAHLVGVEPREGTFSESTSLDGLLPILEGISQDITATIFPQERQQQSASVSSPSTPQKETSSNTKQPLNQGFVYQDGGPQGQGKLNPQFEYTDYQANEGRWRSQSLPFTGLGMVTADADADGSNEIFVLKENGVKAYAFENNKLIPLGEYSTALRLQCLNINIMDMNRDGYLEIVVSAMQKERVESFILNFKQGSFQVVDEGIGFFLNVVRIPPEYMQTLVGQRKGKDELFDGEVQEVLRIGGELRLQQAVSLPTRTNVFNFAFLPYKDSYKTIVVSENDRLQVFNHQKEIQGATSKAYAASALGIVKNTSFPGLGKSKDDPVRFYFIPTRLVPCNLDRNDEFELLVNRNISLAAQFFTRYRYFPKGEIHNLFWDGMGLAPVWKTRPINGTVVDYGIADMNNDDSLELYVCVTTHPGLTGFKSRRTVVYSYAINVAQGGVDTRSFYLQSGSE